MLQRPEPADVGLSFNLNLPWQLEPLHCDKISHLTYTLLTCLQMQIIKHCLHVCSGCRVCGGLFCNIIASDGGGWCVCVPVSVLRCDTPAGPGPRQSFVQNFNLKNHGTFACKHHSDHPSPEKGYTSKSGFIISTKTTFWMNSSWFRIWCWLIQNYPKLLR